MGARPKTRERRAPGTRGVDSGESLKEENAAMPIVRVLLREGQEKIEFIPLSFWYDAPLISRDSDRRHDP